MSGRSDVVTSLPNTRLTGKVSSLLVWSILIGSGSVCQGLHKTYRSA